MKPSNMTFEEAAAGASTGGLTALSLLRTAKIKEGQTILIYGASGSVGTFAVQLAKHFGAEVTGVCSTANIEMVKSLGADKVIDYTKHNFADHPERYDIVFDAVDKLPKQVAKKLRGENGVYLNVVRNFKSEEEITTDDLIYIRDLIEEGKVRTVIDRTYTLDEIVEAHRYVEQGHKKGHVVITV